MLPNHAAASPDLVQQQRQTRFWAGDTPHSGVAMRRKLRLTILAAAWLVQVAGLVVIAANPGVPSLGYAALWLAVVAIARATALALPWLAVAVDLALVPVCFLGLEIGGLILIPSLLLFAVGDALPEGHTEDPAA
jgi:hypothetical protein